jgi:hypothetical protein
MATRSGTPVYEGAPGYVALSQPFDWLTIGGDDACGVMKSSVTRGQPVPLSWWQMRKVRGPGTIPQAVPVWSHSRPYSRGAGAYAPHFGSLSYNPIGAGIYAPYKLPPCAGPGARYQAGAIFFDVQSIPTGIRMSPSMSVESLNALIATSHVSTAYATTG